MLEKSAFMPLSIDELTEIDGGSTKIFAIIMGVATLGLTVVALATGSEWVAAGAATCGLITTGCALAPSI